MVKLTGTLSKIGVSKVLVVGDIFLDTYTIGKARRISPEAPVAVVQVHHEEHRPGGAGNVMLNLVSLGAEVLAMGRVGEDTHGSKLCAVLAEEGVSLKSVLPQKDYPTPVKNRIIAENQQIVRVDHEQILTISPALEAELIATLPRLLEGVQVVAVSDYGKGFLSRELLKAIIEGAKAKRIPVIVDPKGIDFTRYQGATVIKPNLSEAYAAANLPSDAPLELVANRILAIAECDVVMITRSEAGISLFYKDGLREDFPVRVREIKDVTGAGDTVLAMLTCALASGLSLREAAQLSNVAAGIAIERFGCARVSLSDLSRRLLEFDAINKVFDEEHLFALQEALRGRKITLLGISSEKGFTTTIFSSIKKLKERSATDLIVYIRDPNPDETFVEMLASLQDVNFIIVNAESLKNLCNQIEPDEVFIVHGAQMEKLDRLNDLFVYADSE